MSSSSATRAPLWVRLPRQLGRDYAYVLPGFFISVFAFVLLIPMLSVSLGTFIVWVGALLLPLTLVLAGAFARLSRSRLRHWGVDLPRARYRTKQPGMFGWMKTMADPRLWLDLVFETLIAFPLRTLTFSVAVSWTATTLGGLTYFFWGMFLPEDNNGLVELVLDATSNGAIPSSISGSFALEAAFNFVTGLVFLISLPAVLHGLASLDALVTKAALGNDGGPASHGAQSGQPDLPPWSSYQGPRPDSVANRSTQETEHSEPHVARFASADGWAWLTTTFAAVVLLAISWPLFGVLYAVPVVLAMVVAIVHSASLVAAVRWPVVGMVGNAVAVLATAAVTASTLGPPWPWPVTTLMVHGFVLLLVALRRPWPYAVVGWLVASAAPLPAVFLLRTDVSGGALSSLIVAASVSAGVLALGILVRQQLLGRSALQAARRASAEESAQRRELQERNRIAQELHDVVAHSMSVISVQATTAEYRLPGMDERTAGEFTSIAQSSRRALTEMRGLLTILRGSADAQLVPQPTLADVPALIESTRQSGARIEFDVRSGRDSLDTDVPAATALTAYRVLQEALSNAVRHSPGSAITVGMDVSDRGIVMDVVNGPADDAASGSAVPAAPGAGLGLAGIRERVEALGGSVHAGPTDDGGFRVRAELPVG
ncbi:sensor histidine kinase [Kocuria carniphila]|uniref:histidine kinase n=1 Tax=Kocuria carniphila TaxID=262208 RepID=A0ABV3V2I8_9MICC